jgi:hypothetical protein
MNGAWRDVGGEIKLHHKTTQRSRKLLAINVLIKQKEALN